MVNASERVRLAQQRLASDDYQREMNQIPLSQVMESRIKLADEKALYVQSLVEYKIALCKLDKAIGKWGHFSGFVLTDKSEGNNG